MWRNNKANNWKQVKLKKKWEKKTRKLSKWIFAGDQKAKKKLKMYEKQTKGDYKKHEWKLFEGKRWEAEEEQ